MEADMEANHDEQSLTGQAGNGHRSFIDATRLTNAAVSKGLVSRPMSALAQGAAEGSSAASQKPVITGISNMSRNINHEIAAG